MPDAVGGMTRNVVFGFGDWPPRARKGFAAWLDREGVPVLFDHRVQEVQAEAARIGTVRFGHAPFDGCGVPAPGFSSEGSHVVEAKIFIDASYEGDLMAQSGVSYRVGRESTDAFGEPLAGVGEPTNWTPIDPYLDPGQPESGLLVGVDPDHGLAQGSADGYTQAYNFRFSVTTDARRRVPFGRPRRYRCEEYELVGRYVQHLVQEHGDDQDELARRLVGIFPGWLNEGDYNYQRASLVTIAPLGESRHYQDAGWDERSAIWRHHIEYLRGLHYFMSTDLRVPEFFRVRTAELGLDRAMYPDTEGWPHQLYVRVARRMRGRYTLTHQDVTDQFTVDDSVGLALYGVDVYPVRRYACRGSDYDSPQIGVATEGNMFIGGSNGTGRPFQVPYRAITPQRDECVNLLVPVSLSATHVAYAATRMEPVFSVLGESSGVAAAHCVQEDHDVQDLDIPKLQERLQTRGQVISWPELPTDGSSPIVAARSIPVADGRAR